MKIFPLSDPILLPLAPTMAEKIADYLQVTTQQVYGRSLNNYDNVATDMTQDLTWHRQCQQSIKLATTSPYQYVSTIAHRLAAKSSFTPLEICQQLKPLTLVAHVTDDRLDLCCWYNAAGYIYFQPTTGSIARWLNYIHDLPLSVCLTPDRTPEIRIAIYAHARCCSTLELAASEKLVTITTTWQIVAPGWSIDRSYPSVPNCQKNSLAAGSVCLFQHPAQDRLIHVLMRVLDAIYGQSSRTEVSPISTISLWTKLTIELAESWLEFYRHCRIFGDLKSQNPHLAIARCGLTAISRRYLQVLMENYLGVKAAIDLD
jgi:hypothetical protein